jgi:O-antigen/teichoic acid export membrane protein
MIPDSVRSDLKRYATDGTPYILAGTIVASLGAYVFQVVGGRALGAADFDPITALLTVHFLVFTVLLLPIEQFEIRRVTLDRRGGGAAVAWVIFAGATGATAFTYFARDQFFDGEATYALVGLVTVAGNALLALGRGHLAGMRRFRAYGLVSGVVAAFRVVMALVFLRIASTGLSVGWALALAPFIVVLWRPFRSGRPKDRVRDPEAGGRFLTGFVLASAASQVLLLLAPMAVGILTDEPGVMSVVFVTFQLFRAPIVMTQNMLARLLPPLTGLARVGRDDDLRKWALRFGISGLVLAPIAAVGGGLLGPAVVRTLFGAEFEPAWEVAALAAAGMIIAAASLFAGQVLVARGRTMLLAVAWVLGFAVAIAALIPSIGDPGLRVSVAFVAGETGALIAICAAAAGRRQAPVGNS